MKNTLKKKLCWHIINVKFVLETEGVILKDLTLLVWLTQFGLSVVAPLIGFPLLTIWLQSKFGWGQWVFWIGLGLGIFSAIDGLISSLKLLHRLTRKKADTPPPLSFSEHD